MNKFLFILLSACWLLLTANAFSQDRHKIDSLQKELNNFEVYKKQMGSKVTPLFDSSRANILDSISMEFWGNTPDSTMYYAQQNLSLSQQIGYKKGIGNAYNSIGILNDDKGNFTQALEYYRKAVSIYDEIGYKQGIGETYINIGVIYIEQGIYPEALKNELTSLKVSESVGYKIGIAQAYNNIGNIYTQIGNNKEALKNYLSSLKIEKELGNKYDVAGLDHNIAIIYNAQKQVSDALIYISNAIKINQETGNKVFLGHNLSLLGGIYGDQGNYSEAFKGKFESLKIFEEVGDKGSIAGVYCDIAGLFEKQDNLTEALKYVTKGLLLALEIESKPTLKVAYEELAIINSKLKNYKAAYDNEVLFKQMNDSLFNKENEKKLTSLQMQYDFDKKQDSIKAAETKQQDSIRTEQVKKDAVAQKEIQNQKNILYSMFAGLFLVVSFSGFVFRSLRISRKQKKVIEKEKQRAEQSERYKQQFLANMSHEIRTPMNAVMGMTNLLLDKNPRSDQFNYLDGIKKSSDNLLHIINDILDLSKVEAGKIELEQIDFSVRDVVEQIKQTLQHKAEEKGLQLLTHIDKSVPDVLVGDPTRLIQVLINLAGNAIKFTEKGSVILHINDLTPSPSPLGEGRSPSLLGEGFRMRFSVEDTGIGIPKEKLQTVFESFSQAHSSDTRKFGGTGLGLTISKQLVELMGGTILVESEEGGGTTFSFEITLPIGSFEKLNQQKSIGAVDGSILNGLRILLVEDNEYNRIVAIDTLKSKAQIEIDIATNGREAIELLSNNNYDVILMDIQMPEMNGYEATQKIRAEFASPKNQTPIIALTASVIRSDLDKCKAAGMNSYVPKPFNASQLIGTIAEVTGRVPSEQLAIATENHNLLQETLNELPITNISPELNLARLKNFCDGDEARMKKYITMFVDSVPESLLKIEAGLSEENRSEIFKQVHALKPRLQMMGVPNILGLVIKVERLCNSEAVGFDELRTEVNELVSMARLTLAQLTALQSGNHIP